MDRLELPSGGWVDFHDPNTAIRGKHVKALINIGDADAEGKIPITGDLVFQWAEIVAEPLLSAWSVPYDPALPLPTRSNHTIEDLSAQDSRTLQEVLYAVAQAAIKGEAYTEEARQGEEQPEAA